MSGGPPPSSLTANLGDLFTSRQGKGIARLVFDIPARKWKVIGKFQ